MMNRIFLTLIMAGILAILVPTMGAWTSPSAGRLPGQEIVGSWIVSLTQEDGTPLPPVILNATIDGGYVIGGVVMIDFPDESIQLSSIQAGEWIRTGDREFATTDLLPVYDKSGNEFLFTAKSWGTLTLNESLDAFSGHVVEKDFDPDGNLIYSTSVNTQGTRIKAEILQ